MNNENKTIYEQLIEPFDYEEINWRITNAFSKDNTKKTAKAIVVPYLKKEVIQDRLDKVFGFDGWSNTYRKWGVDAQLCGISFKVGDEIITKWDGAPNSNLEEVKVKGGLSDSFKRAAKMIGIGRYLAKFNNIILDVDLKGGKLTPTIRPIDIQTTLKSRYKKEVDRIFNFKNDGHTNAHFEQKPINDTSGNLNTFNNGNSNQSNNGQEEFISQSSINSIRMLLKQKNVNLQSVLDRYQVNSLDELTESEGLKTINILIKQNAVTA